MLLDGMAMEASQGNGRCHHRGSLQVQRSTLKRNGKRRASEPAKPPRLPSPTLTHLTAEELSIINSVIHRQERFEQEEADRINRLQHDLQSMEERVKHASSTKSRLKQVDLRLCRLCFKTKFADGIGRSCYDCHRRVCNRCGTFSRSVWSERKNKMSRGKWRCNVCHKRREVLMATGRWYHGDDASPALNSSVFHNKLPDARDVLGEEEHETDTSWHSSHTGGRHTDPRSEDTSLTSTAGCWPDSDHPTTVKWVPRKRLLSCEEFADVLDEEESHIDDAAYAQERKERRQERSQRRQGRRRLRRMSVGTSTEEDGIIKGEVPSMLDVDSCPMHGTVYAEVNPRAIPRDGRSSSKGHNEGHARHSAHDVGTGKPQREGHIRAPARDHSSGPTQNRKHSHDSMRANVSPVRNNSTNARTADNAPIHTVQERRKHFREYVRHVNGVSKFQSPVRSSALRAQETMLNTLNSPLDQARKSSTKSDNPRFYCKNEAILAPAHEDLRRASLPAGSSNTHAQKRNRFQKQVSADSANANHLPMRYKHPFSPKLFREPKTIPSISIHKASTKRPKQTAINKVIYHQQLKNSEYNGEFPLDNMVFRKAEANERQRSHAHPLGQRQSSLREEDRFSANSGNLSSNQLEPHSPTTPDSAASIRFTPNFRNSKHSMTSGTSNLSAGSMIAPSTPSSFTSSLRGTSAGSLAQGSGSLHYSEQQHYFALPEVIVTQLQTLTANSSAATSKTGKYYPQVKAQFGHLQSVTYEGADDVSYEGLPSFIANPITAEDSLKKEHSLLAQTKASFRRGSVGNQARACLSKNPNENNCRTNGLGMIVVGGRLGQDGKLGAYVEEVIPGGSADLCGICVGDQILEWDGCGLEDATYEETRHAIQKSGHRVQLVVMYNRRKQKALSTKVGRKISSDNLQKQEAARQESGEQEGARMPATDSTGGYGNRRCTLGDVLPDQIWKPSPVKRTLPRTPDELRRLQPRLVAGQLQLRLWHDQQASTLAAHIARARGVNEIKDSADNAFIDAARLPSNSRAFVRVRFLHHDKTGSGDEFFTELSALTTQLEWDKAFVYSDVTADKLNTIALEATVWGEDKLHKVVFLGEVLLDLEQANTHNQLVWYNLENHDENNGELCYPVRVNPATFQPVQLSKKMHESVWKSLPAYSSAPDLQNVLSHSVKGLLRAYKSHDSDLTGSVPNLLYTSKDKAGGELSIPASRCTQRSASDSGNRHDRRLAQRVQDLRHKMRNAVTKMSVRLADRRPSSAREHDKSSPRHSQADRTDSKATLMRRSSTGNIGAIYRRLTSRTTLTNMSLDIPSLSRGDELGSEHSSHVSLTVPASIATCSAPTSTATSDVEDSSSMVLKMRPAPDGDDITSLLGPGQLPPKPSQEKLVKGDIKLALMVTKGQLEIDVICAKGISTKNKRELPDTYVKTYLVAGSNKRLQKKKTSVVRASVDPVYRQKIKYSASNVHGRFVQVLIKHKLGNFERNPCLGEVVIKLDTLDLSCYTIGWYKLFKESATNLGSSESLCVI